MNLENFLEINRRGLLLIDPETVVRRDGDALVTAHGCFDYKKREVKTIKRQRVTSSHRHIETERGASKERAEKLGEKMKKSDLSKRISLSLSLFNTRAHKNKNAPMIAAPL